MKMNMNMKAAVLFIVVAMLLAACGGGGSPSSSAAEKAALEYVEVFINGSDTEKKEQFIIDYVHADIAPLFQMGLAFEGDEAKEPAYMNAKAVETVSYSEEGQTVQAVLVKADGDKEIIVLFLDDKIAFAFPKSEAEEADGTYDEMRSRFKA